MRWPSHVQAGSPSAACAASTFIQQGPLRDITLKGLQSLRGRAYIHAYNRY